MADGWVGWWVGGGTGVASCLAASPVLTCGRWAAWVLGVVEVDVGGVVVVVVLWLRWRPVAGCRCRLAVREGEWRSGGKEEWMVGKGKPRMRDVATRMPAHGPSPAPGNR